MTRGDPPLASLGRVEALLAWRESASVVAACWWRFLEALPSDRTLAFASYVAALDAEEAAADELAVLTWSLAA